jgi:DNA mismatch repair protein MutL
MRESGIITLDEDTVKKIAAGEVIERPASVVKELIENSIDAESSKITVELKNGGKSLIHVSDNGKGMSRDDAIMSFKRYTTSKMRKIEDLDNLSTLGFRGEALASICAVSRVELVTKQKGAVAGTKLVIEAGGLRDVKEVGCPEGTSITIKELFYNLPARKKHLKSARRELAHVAEMVTRYALTNSRIFFIVEHEGKRMLESPSTEDLRDVVSNIFGTKYSKNLITIHHEAAQYNLKISGLTGKPDSARSSSNMQFFSVNGRIVSSRLIGASIREAYGTLLPKNRYPLSFISLEVNPDSLDVNIHPTKMRVKFLHEKDVYEAVTSAVRNALKSESLVPEGIPDRTPRRNAQRERIASTEGEIKRRPSKQVPLTIESYRKRFSTVPQKASLPELKVIGDFGRTYVLGESPKGMVILDQHAAHERVLYERLLEGEEKRKIQNLLSPITLELSARETALLEEFEEHLKNLGFGMEPFGKNTIRINSVPVVIGSLVSQETILDILGDMITLPKAPEEGVEERIAQVVAKRSASAACKSAIKAGEGQSLETLESLVKELYQTSNPYTCPHGRPTMIHITKEELEKRFLRT